MVRLIEREFVRNISFPFTNWLYNRRSINTQYKSLIYTEMLSKEELQTIQLRKLKNIIKYANKWVPFYKSRFNEIGFSPNDFGNFDDLKKIPPLSRQDVIDNYHNLVDSRLQDQVKIADLSLKGPGEPIVFSRFKKNKLVRNTSSGSTGYPTTFYENGSVTAINWAHEMRLKKWYGICPGEREARLVRMSTDYMPNHKIIKMRKLLWNQLLVPGVNLKEKDYEVIYEEILKFKPKVLWGFTSALTSFAEFLNSKNIQIEDLKIKLLVSWAAPLYSHEQNILEKTFKCPVTNIYGTRELGHLAGYCPNGSLHVNQEHYFIEVDKTDNFRDQVKGELLVTSLVNTPMPFIRYRTGDIGSVKYIKCKCGRNLQVIDEFVGRTGEIYKTKDGRMISPNFWCRTFMDPKLARSIQRFQVIYKKNGVFNIKLVKNANFSYETEKELEKYLKENFQNSIRFNFEYVPEIKPQISGKYQMVLKE